MTELVGAVQGTGLLCAIEPMRDGERRIPFEDAPAAGARVEAAAQRHGLLLRAVGERTG